MLVAEIICLLIGMAPLVAGYYQAGLYPVAIGCLVIGLLWPLSQWRQSGRISSGRIPSAPMASLGLCVFVGAGAFGVFWGLSPILMAFSTLGSLMAWDLAGFSRRLRVAAGDDDLRKLEKMHLVRLAGMGATGLVLILAALNMNLRFSFGWAFLLTLAAILGMLQLADHLRRGG